MAGDVLELLRAAAPELADAVVGVTDEQIQVVETELGIRFPATYRSFLRTMGESAAGFELGNATQTTRFLDVLAALEPPVERNLRYWRVSVEQNIYNPVSADFYLDLATHDGEDADLLELCDPPDTDDDVPPAWTTFFDRLRVRAFYQCVATVLANNYSIFVNTDSDPNQVFAAVRAVLQHESFEEFFPYRDRVVLFHSRGGSVSMRRPRDNSVTGTQVSLYAKSDQDAQLLVNKLRDHIPATVRVIPPRR